MLPDWFWCYQGQAEGSWRLCSVAPGLDRRGGGRRISGLTDWHGGGGAVGVGEVVIEPERGRLCRKVRGPTSQARNKCLNVRRWWSRRSAAVTVLTGAVCGGREDDVVGGAAGSERHSCLRRHTISCRSTSISATAEPSRRRAGFPATVGGGGGSALTVATLDAAFQDAPAVGEVRSVIACVGRLWHRHVTVAAPWLPAQALGPPDG